MTLIPGFIRDDDSTAAGVANFATFRGIKGSRPYYSSNSGVRSITMNPFSAREFGYGAVLPRGGAGNGVGPIGNNADPTVANDRTDVGASTIGCWGFDGDGDNNTFRMLPAT